VTPLDIETPDLAALGTFIAATSGAGMDWFPSSDGALERQLARYANLPYRSEAVELVEPAGGGEAAPIGEPQKTNKLLETVGGIGAIIELSQAVASKTMPKENAVAILMEILGLEAEAAERMVSQTGGTE